jgi:hypothetical protein
MSNKLLKKILSLILVSFFMVGCVPTTNNPDIDEPDPTPKFFALNDILKDDYVFQKEGTELQSIVRSYQYRPLTNQPHQFNLIYITGASSEELLSYFTQKYTDVLTTNVVGTQLEFVDESLKINVNIVSFLITMVTINVESNPSWNSEVIVDITIPVEYEGEVVSMSRMEAVLADDITVDVVIYSPQDSIDATMQAFENTYKDKEGFQVLPEGNGIQWIEDDMNIIITRGLYSELLDEEPIKEGEVDQEMIMIVYTTASSE